jgi:hypothetical protein
MNLTLNRHGEARRAVAIQKFKANAPVERSLLRCLGFTGRPAQQAALYES